MKKLILVLSVLGCVCFLTRCSSDSPEQADTLSVSQAAIIVSCNGGTFGDIIVSTNTSWTASSSTDWVRIITTSGSSGDNQPLYYEVSQNTSEQRRTATITLTAGVKIQMVQVIQDGANHQIVDEFLSRWYPTNCGTQPYGDYYRFDQLPSCPSGYHVPSEDEFGQLVTYPSLWGMGPGGVNGRWFCPTTAAISNPSSANGCVFFPAAGLRGVSSGGSVATYGRGTRGNYWSSTPDEFSSENAYLLFFGSDNVGGGWGSWRSTGNDGLTRWDGQSVRCIKDE